MINEETARATAKLAALCAKAEHCTGEMDKKLLTTAAIPRLSSKTRYASTNGDAARSSRHSTPKACRQMSTRLCSTVCPTALISNN